MNATTALDYFAVYVKNTAKDKPRHICNVIAREGRHALRVARHHGLATTRHSTATRIGRAGYHAALKAVFPLMNVQADLPATVDSASRKHVIAG